MPRTKDIEGQTVAFPDLEMEKQEHKALLKAAKDYAKAKANRDAVLSTEKEKVDAKEQKLIGLMHENKVSKFKYDGVTTEIMEGKERVTVKIDEDDDEPMDEGTED